MFIKFLHICLIVCVITISVRAQEGVFITQPAAQKVGTQDKFEVKYILKNIRNATKFELPPMADFQIVSGPNSSQQTSMINGEVSRSMEITYVMKAKRKGKLLIPGGIAILQNGKQIHSNAVSIDVIEGSVVDNRALKRQRDPMQDFFDDDPLEALIQEQQQLMQQLQRQHMQRVMPPATPVTPPSHDEVSDIKDIYKHIFILAIPDKTEVSLGEQITVSYKLYTRFPMDVRPTSFPSLLGFWSQDFNIPYPPQPHREIYNGREYDVLEFKRTALFPTKTGELQLDPAQAEGTVNIKHPRKDYGNEDPTAQLWGTIFDDLPNEFDYETVPVVLKSQPVKIIVHDIPTENKPSTFQGAIGNYKLDSKIDKTEMTTDDNGVITLTISGTGNLKMIGTPTLQFPPEIDAFDPKIDDTISNTNDIIAGYKTFKYSFSPREPGVFVIPSTEFVYYDPTDKNYKTLSTPSYTIQVKQGKNASAQSRLPKDIHDINNVQSSLLKYEATDWMKSPIYWSGFGLPLLAYIGLFFFKRKENNIQRNTVLFKSKRANKVALKRLANAENYLKQTAQKAFYEETSKAVWLYISDKLNIPLAKLSKDVAAQKLNEKKVNTDLQLELFRITNECEMALYAPDAGTLKMHQTYSDAFKLIGKLEDELT